MFGIIFLFVLFELGSSFNVRLGSVGESCCKIFTFNQMVIGVSKEILAFPFL